MKNHHHNGPNHPASLNDTSVIHEAIAARAYQLWEQRGQPEDQADALWLEAEQELVTGQRGTEPEKRLPVSF